VKRRILPGGILTLSLAVVLLAATASTASADRFLTPWYCPPPPTPPTTLDQIPLGCRSYGPGGHGGEPFFFNFGDRQVGTTSPPQGFGLAVLDDSFNPRISVSGDYAQTNNCPPTLAVPPLQQIQTCLITVSFTPRGTGPKRVTLSTGPGGPKARLIGNGVTTPTPSPGLQLWGKKKQNPQADSYCDRYLCNVILNASCGVDGCTARATGRLTNVKRRKLTSAGPRVIRPGRTEWLTPELTKASQRREVRKALDRGENVQAIVTVRATDAAGNVATAKRTLKLVKYTGHRPPAQRRQGPRTTRG
jgi:hypothetical protein